MLYYVNKLVPDGSDLLSGKERILFKQPVLSTGSVSSIGPGAPSRIQAVSYPTPGWMLTKQELLSSSSLLPSRAKVARLRQRLVGRVRVLCESLEF